MLRTGMIAIVVGAVLLDCGAGWPAGRCHPVGALAFVRGHWVEVWSSTGCALALRSHVACRLRLALGVFVGAAVSLLAWV